MSYFRLVPTQIRSKKSVKLQLVFHLLQLKALLHILRRAQVMRAQILRNIIRIFLRKSLNQLIGKFVQTILCLMKDELIIVVYH